MNLLDQIVILDNHVSQHIIQRIPRLNLQILTALVNDVKNFRYQLSLCLQIAFKYPNIVSKNITLLIMLRFLY